MTRIATHAGGFHLDDVVALAILKIVDPTSEVIRTRDVRVIGEADIVVDVGQVYDPKTFRFDHHGKANAGSRENGVPYASAGLIWLHYGKKLVGNDEAWRLVDERLMQFVDAIDTGNKYHDNRTYTLNEIVQTALIIAEGSNRDVDSAFYDIVDEMMPVVRREIERAQLQGKTNIEIRQQLAKVPDKPYVILPRALPLWQDVIVGETDKLYVIYPSSDGNYRVRCVPTQVNGFELRKALPPSWRNKSGVDLQIVTGIKGAEFCHTTGYMAATKTVIDAIEFAERASYN